MATTHTQCTLRRGNVWIHAWIPTVFAKLGEYVKLRGEDGWKVENVGAEMDSAYVKTHEYDYKRAFASLEGK